MIAANEIIVVDMCLADPGSGGLTRHDPKTYRPGAALDRAVRARDGTCRMPGCTTPAIRCSSTTSPPIPTAPPAPRISPVYAPPPTASNTTPAGS